MSDDRLGKPLQDWADKCQFSHKNRFETRREALDFADTLDKGLKSKAYPCVHCMGWHISTVRPDAARQRKKRRKS